KRAFTRRIPRSSCCSSNRKLDILSPPRGNGGSGPVRMADMRAIGSGAGRRCEEAPARAVRSFAPPERTVRARLHLIERHDLVQRAQHVAGARYHDLFTGQAETIRRAAAPFTGRVAITALVDPIIVRKRRR